MAALKKGNDIRTKRAKRKRELKRGERSPLLTLAAPPAELDTMKVFDLLLAMPKVGRVKANKFLAKVKVSPSKTVGGLSERQRRELMALLGRREL
jgi:hypothetical protein